MGNMHVKYMRSFLVILSLLLLQTQLSLFNCTGRESNAPDIFRSGVALTRLYTAQVCELFNWVDTVTIHYYWRWRRSGTEILDLCLGPGDAENELGSFFIH